MPAPHTEVTPPAGPRTAVIPRKRQQTFATHVELQSMLAGTNIDDRATSEVKAIVAPPAPPTSEPPPAPPPIEHTGALPSSRALLILVGLGATVLAIASIAVFLRGRAAILAPDAAPKYDAAWYSIQQDSQPYDSAAPEALPDAMIDASLAAPADAAIARIARDAAAVAVHVDAAAHALPNPGTATLKIGADPWADIVIDGVARGRTPAEVTVTAGHHVVELVYRGDDPPKKKAFPIDPAANEVVPLQATFDR